MKAAQYLWLSVTSLGLIACAPVETPPSEPMTRSSMAVECVYPRTNQAAPNWICDEAVEGLTVSAVGVAEPTRAGVAYQKNIAATDAIGQLAENLKVRVGKMVKNYLGTTGVGDDETVDAAAETVIKTVTSATVRGATRHKSITGPQGRMYLLMGLNGENTEEAVEEAVKISMRNERAAWQKFLAEKGYDELAAEIAKQEVR